VTGGYQASSRIQAAGLYLQEVHPCKVRLAGRHRASVAFKAVIVAVVVVPERAADVDGIVTHGKLQSAANGDALRQTEGKREPIG